ncbi:zinc ABC transporter permease AztB [Arthrobacter sp. 35W]|uniref:zinc ABC transporter permease AztB n=1 Tax=Arthrobacter sp. 35W TaxID=1132441 RepID=UPI00041C8A15|nr:zinc ABC transporter permease AztB [Arthrobacter sp. 35W]
MDWLIEPFDVAFVRRALWAGLLAAALCGIVGTWIVVRGMSFLGDAMSHGMLPGIATASLLGGNLLLGAALSAAAMAAGVTLVARSTKLGHDASIGLLFVGMLSLGVIIISSSQSFAVDLAGFLFGDILAVRGQDLATLAAALAATAVAAAAMHRPFTALAFDERKAASLGLCPRLAHFALLGLVTLAVTTSFQVVGTLLVFGLLIAPAAAASLWARSIPGIMALACGLGALSVATGLLVSWHAGTAAGATIAATAVALFALLAAASSARRCLI